MIIEKHFNGTIAKIDSLGGEIFSWVKNDIDYLWGGDEKSWTGRSPHLFPSINVTATPTVKMKQGEYEMTKHGLVRLKPFDVISESNNEITLGYFSNEDTLLRYPFYFEFYVTHTLFDDGFRTTYKVVNKDNDTLPYCIGGHPGFNVPLCKDEEFEEYQIVFDQEVSMKALTYLSSGLYAKDKTYQVSESKDRIDLNYSIFDQDAIVMADIESHSLKVQHKEKGYGFRFDYPGFPVLALWTKPLAQAPYLCIEPWYGLPAMESDSEYFNEKPYLETCEPNQEKTYYYQMSVI